jgi:hypothetical protein
MADPKPPAQDPSTRDLPTGASERMNSADPASKTTAAAVQRDPRTTRNPDAKVPSDLYPDPPGVDDTTPGAPDD